jgi:hypothetical protein
MNSDQQLRSPHWNGFWRSPIASKETAPAEFDAGPSLAMPWHAQRSVRVAVVWALVAWLVLQLSFAVWVHYSLAGNFQTAFLSGSQFGVPAREAAAGMKSATHLGYDGQFYFSAWGTAAGHEARTNRHTCYDRRSQHEF